VSYRRMDSALAARWLAETLERTFGKGTVFIDTDGIRTGSNWPDGIDAALARASVVVPIVGPGWLRAADDDGRRRLDIADDWVRREIEHALAHDKTLLPILVSGATLPSARSLPASIVKMLNTQAVELRNDHWPEDAKKIVTALERMGFRRVEPKVIYPAPLLHARSLSERELAEFTVRMPAWSVVTRPGDSDSADERTELTRAYQFASFEDAIHFMTVAARRIARADHHPDWRNVWRTVSVRLTTWDIGHKPSFKDIEVAAYLESLYGEYASPDPQHVPDKSPGTIPHSAARRRQNSRPTTIRPSRSGTAPL